MEIPGSPLSYLRKISGFLRAHTPKLLPIIDLHIAVREQISKDWQELLTYLKTVTMLY
jgi:hypothetical protein